MLPKYETLVEEIKSKRKNLGWSQKKLARRAGVSKSLVGKLERNENIPNYKNVRNIYRALNKEDKRHSAEEFITSDIISVKPDDKIKDAATIMKENDFSQLPVKHRGKYIGIITSQDIANQDNRELSVKKLDYHIPPKIPHDTPKDDFKTMFKSNNAVLVQKGNRVIGIITPANLL